jgi:cysteine desulfurase
MKTEHGISKAASAKLIRSYRHPSYNLLRYVASPSTNTQYNMANISPSVLKQASRLASKSSLSAATRRNACAFSRVANSQISRAQSRSYVSETKRNDASITDTKVETAIRLDKKDFEKAGLSMNSQQNGSEVSVSPMAGRFSMQDSMSCM